MTVREPLCEDTGLPVVMCGCKDCRPDLNVRQERTEAVKIEAKFRSRCSSCHRFIEIGDVIYKVDEGGGSSAWLHEQCLAAYDNWVQT